MTTLEKIESKKKAIENIDVKIAELEDKKKNIEKEIEHLEVFEIKGLLDSIELPYPQVVSILQDLANKNKEKKG